jgi:protein-L-isoaspartate(D-aspartate) O-methyltransferase
MRRRPLLLLLLAAITLSACKSPPDESNPSETTNTAENQSEPAPSEPTTDDRAEERRTMVRRQLAGRDITDERVLEAMRAVPRHRFVPPRWQSSAYADSPLPIGHDQTISQPYIVAAMTQALDLSPDQKVLEIGTGSGYQAAILAELAGEVFSIEIVCDLAERAREALEAQGYDNLTIRCGDGYKGWPDQAPFDRIIVTAAPPNIPQALVDQLKPGGRMVLPVGERLQALKVLRKNPDGTVEEAELMKVRFVPMVRGEETGE